MFLFFLTIRPPPSSTLFPYTTLFRSGWQPAELGRKEFLILSTQGGIRAPDGRPVALGYHTGHWEVGLRSEEHTSELQSLTNLVCRLLLEKKKVNTNLQSRCLHNYLDI